MPEKGGIPSPFVVGKPPVVQNIGMEIHRPANSNQFLENVSYFAIVCVFFAANAAYALTTETTWWPVQIALAAAAIAINVAGAMAIIEHSKLGAQRKMMLDDKAMADEIAKQMLQIQGKMKQ